MMNLSRIEKPSTQSSAASKSSEKHPKISQDPIKRKHKELPWKQMAGMRDKLIHAYFGVDTETLWEAAKNNIPQLKAPIQKMLEEQENATT